MPGIHFIGTFEYASGNNADAVSLTWEILPGNAAWNLINGLSYGETQTAFTNERQIETLNHPLDIQYEAYSAEGWPLLVCELWDRTHSGVRSLIGCGIMWLPQSGSCLTDIPLWRPQLKHNEDNSIGNMLSYEDVGNSLLPYQPSLKLLREVMIESYKRPQIEATAAGAVRLNVTTISNGFDTYGVSL